MNSFSVSSSRMSSNGVGGGGHRPLIPRGVGGGGRQRRGVGGGGRCCSSLNIGVGGGGRHPAQQGVGGGG